jgi:predicted Zn-dependent protease
MAVNGVGVINPSFTLGGAAARPRLPDEEQSLNEARELCESRRFREALGALNRLVIRDARNAEAWVLLARAHLDRGEHGEALRAAETAGKLSSDSEPMRLAAIALVALERFEDAAAQSAEAVRRDPTEWRNFVEQARVLVKTPERLAEARSAAQNAVRLAPHKVTPHMVAGQVELAGGEIEAAARAFRQVFTIDPANPGAYNELARLHLHGPAASDGVGRRSFFKGRRGK